MKARVSAHRDNQKRIEKKPISHTTAKERPLILHSTNSVLIIFSTLLMCDCVSAPNHYQWIFAEKLRRALFLTWTICARSKKKLACSTTMYQYYVQTVYLFLIFFKYGVGGVALFPHRSRCETNKYPWDMCATMVSYLFFQYGILQQSQRVQERVGMSIKETKIINFKITLIVIATITFLVKKSCLCRHCFLILAFLSRPVS